MNKPRIFIGSSREGLDVAYAIQQNLELFGEITIWNQDVFKLSVPIITNLIRALDNFDFAIFIFNSDDIINMRGNMENIVRDNVIFEIGLFTGRLGAEKVYFIKPRDQTLHLPSDMLGVVGGDYDSKRTDKNLIAATSSFCNQVKREILEKVKAENKSKEWFKEIIFNLSPTYRAIVSDLTSTHISLLLAINKAPDLQIKDSIISTLRDLRNKGLLEHNDKALSMSDKIWLTEFGKELANALENSTSH